MLLTLFSLALLTLSLSLAVNGIILLRRPGWQRVAGVVLLMQGLGAAALQIALSVIPVGIGTTLIRVPLADLAQSAGAVVIVLGVALAVYVAGRWLMPRLLGLQRRRLATTLALVALPVLLLASMGGLYWGGLSDRERERDPGRRQITLSPGFNWSIYARGQIDNPTTMAFGPDGKLYIGDIGGTLWVASDANGDHAAETVHPWAQDFKLLVGLAWHEGELYVASAGKVEALRDSDNDGRADARRTLVDGLPSMVIVPHSNNGLTFGPDGRLYFGVGSTSDTNVENDWRAASILSVNPDGSDLRQYAQGLGNSFDLAFDSTGQLFAGDNSPKASPDESRAGVDPGDEFNHIVENGHYGFPYFFGDPPKNGGTIGPLVSFPPHSAPTGLSFYSGATFPPEYRDNAFVTLWNRGEVYRIELARSTGGTYLSRSTLFGQGFLYPIDAATGPDGNLYIADFGTSAIYRITYIGQ